MSLKTEIFKFASFASAIGCAGAGVAAVMSGLAPAALGAGILAGAAGVTWTSLDKLETLEEARDALIKQLATSEKMLATVESELQGKLVEITAERDRIKEQLETEIESIKSKCNSLKDLIEYYEVGTDPRLLELPGVKMHVDALRKQLQEKAQELKTTNLELLKLVKENEEIKQDSDEVHQRNEQLDQELADLTNEFNLINESVEREVQLRLYKSIQPYISQAVAAAIQDKLAEIKKLKADLSRHKEAIANSEQMMESITQELIPDVNETFSSQLSEFDSRLIRLTRENTVLQEKIAELQAPRKFPGITYADSAGNQIIDHFSQYDVIFDAHSTELIPGGFTLKFRVDRNPDMTKLSGEEFSKLVSQRGLLGLSNKPLVFSFDQINFIVSVQIFSGFEPCPGHDRDMTGLVNNGSLSIIGGQLTKDLGKVKTPKIKTGKGTEHRTQTGHAPDTHREKFIALGCYPADQFSEVVRLKFVNRVRICAGSTGGKSPILERLAVELAKANNATLWLLNPIPGSQKDWFKVPGILQPGMNADAVIGAKIAEYHREFKRRRNNLLEAQKLEQMVLALDEDNSTARHYESTGEFLKDMYQLSDHVGMGLVTAGQGLNISGLSGGARPKKSEEEKNTGNATRLMAEDWQNVVLVLMSDQVPAHIGKKSFKAPKQRQELLETWDKLNQLCDELNQLEGLTDRVKLGDEKKVSPNAYRVAMVDAPSHAPFFVQLPTYGDFSLDGLRFPAGARVTSPHELEEIEEDDRVLDAFVFCPHCEGSTVTRIGAYGDGDLKYRCGRRTCRRIFRVKPEDCPN